MNPSLEVVALDVDRVTIPLVTLKLPDVSMVVVHPTPLESFNINPPSVVTSNAFLLAV